MQNQSFLKRNIQDKLDRAIKNNPVVLINGARQSGKTTLVEQLCKYKDYSYITFDNIQHLQAAQNDPFGFITNLKTPIVLDEVQRVPEIFLTIKYVVDRNRQPGMFVLTGSANPLLLPRLGDSLAGRMAIIDLFPFSQGELSGIKETFINTIFNENINNLGEVKLTKTDLCKKMVTGGFPPVQQLENYDDRSDWFDNYLTTILQRDVKNLANIEGLSQLPNLMSLIATRASGLFNVAELSRSSKIATTTLHRYITLLQTLFMITSIQPWHSNLSKRIVKSPKIHLVDTGLLLYLQRIDADRLLLQNEAFGKAFENFIVSELIKQSSWNKPKVDLYYFRTHNGVEVDIVLEGRNGEIVGIEVKGHESVRAKDFYGLRHLQKTIGSSFKAGIVIHPGSEIIPFGRNMWSVPIGSLWT